ncbi:MAG: MarR family EPS-associated transcriptional regulator [Gammaproteobacteria bacterium]|nr:MAG: MarR family EPS-associated transcriptional regulator [Gammaproteobacteria bacterium]
MEQTEAQYRILKLIEENPEMTQRQLAEAMGVSLGKLNYILRALIKKGLVKGRNFRNRKDKTYYAYLLTPKGIEEKARATLRFFRQVEAEYTVLKQEVESIVQDNHGSNRLNESDHD